MSSAKILFQLTGSIACYKACHLLSRLVQDGHDVRTVASGAALNFVGEATLEGLSGKPVATDIFAAGGMMEHIHLARWADLFLLCPATATSLNRLATGLGDDLIGALFLARENNKPYVIAPAMNSQMYMHPSVQGSIARLRQWGTDVISTGEGQLACGETGEGRLLEPDLIWSHLQTYLDRTRRRRVLITSGGTREPIDDVRYIGNGSTGRTGAALSEAFSRLGYDVALIRSRDSLMPANPSLCRCEFTTHHELDEALKRTLAEESFDLVIHAAAVSDYHVTEIRSETQRWTVGELPKLSSRSKIELQLEANTKIIERLREYSSNQTIKVAGFKLTSHAEAVGRQAAVAGLFAHADIDWIVHNDLAELTEDRSRHPFALYGSTSGLISRCEGYNELALRIDGLMRGSADLAYQEGVHP